MQPHFSEVIDFIEGQLCLALQLKTPHRIPPILLGGPPGIGKTHFTRELAKVMNRPIRRHSFDASHTGSALMGSDRNWANTQVGLVFEMVCLGLRADPIVLLDELDKADTYRGGHATTPLHSLLEPLTATSVTDISAGVTFDASHIFWVATANELWRIPQPLLSRFRIFDIRPPTASEALTLAQAVAESVHGRFTAFDAPGRRITALVAHLTPREQIQVLEQGYAAALVNDRRQILPQDLPPELRPEADAEAGSLTASLRATSPASSLALSSWISVFLAAAAFCSSLAARAWASSTALRLSCSASSSRSCSCCSNSPSRTCLTMSA